LLKLSILTVSPPGVARGSTFSASTPVLGSKLFAAMKGLGRLNEPGPCGT